MPAPSKETGTKKYLNRLIQVLNIQICLLGLLSCGQTTTSEPSTTPSPTGSVTDEREPSSPTDTPDTTGSTDPGIEVNALPVRKEGVIRLPVGVEFKNETLRRVDNAGFGDNWTVTWTADGNQMTSMSDGAWDPNWAVEGKTFHNMTYRIQGEPESFTRSRVRGYPEFLYGDEDEPGWFGYGIVAIDDTIYSMVTKTPSVTFNGPFRGVKMLKSTDNGLSWYQVNKLGETKLIAPTDKEARNSIAAEDMFFWEEYGSDVNGFMYYPFAYVAFVQNGQAGRASPDDYIYIYSPEGAQANRLLLARAKKEEFEVRDNWEYFKQWNGDVPVWTRDINERGSVITFPTESSDGDPFGWYSWLPSVVWNEGLGVYIMVNGGTYTFNYNWNALDLSGSLGFWYSKNPYGPWTQIAYTDHFTIDDPGNRSYQPKLSPKWISPDGEEMVLIWSDAMADEEGHSHTVNYRWNQMQIQLEISGNQRPSVNAGDDQSIQTTAAGIHQAFLNGVVSDDGLPQGSSLNSEWVKRSGPDKVTFANKNQPQTSATFDQKGHYILQLSASDGELTSSDTVVIDVR